MSAAVTFARRLVSLFATALLLCVTAPAAAQQEQAEQAPANFALAPRGYFQLDLRAFPGWDIVPGEGRSNRPGIELRRVRLGVDGNVKRVGFEVSIDPQDVDGVFVKDAYAQIRFSRALRLRAGQFKAPGTRDYDQSARNMDFLERQPLTLGLGVGRDLGVRADGRVWRLQYQAGAFAGDGAGRDDRSGLTGAGRVALQWSSDLEVGGSVSLGRTHADDTAPPNGPDLRSTTGFRFANGVYVQGRRVRLGTDLEWTPSRWTVTAEFLRLQDERAGQGLDLEDLPDAIGTGFSASLVRRLRTRQDATGPWLVNALLRRPLDAAIRYDYIGFDDAGVDTAADSVRPRATDIRQRGAHAVTVGSTWAITPRVRLMGNVAVEHFSDARSAPEPGRAGPYPSVATRLQFEWP
jgi:phosphate-selective porin